MVFAYLSNDGFECSPNFFDSVVKLDFAIGEQVSVAQFFPSCPIVSPLFVAMWKDSLSSIKKSNAFDFGDWCKFYKDLEEQWPTGCACCGVRMIVRSFDIQFMFASAADVYW